MNDKLLTQHEIALTASTLSGIYQQRNQTQKSIKLLEKAAIADIHSSTKKCLPFIADR